MESQQPGTPENPQRPWYLHPQLLSILESPQSASLNVTQAEKLVLNEARVKISQKTSPQSAASSDTEIDVVNSSPDQNVLTHFSSSPVFGGLCEALREDCTTNTVPHALMDASRSILPGFQAPISVRVGMFQLRFMTMERQHGPKVTELQHVYRLKSGQLETQRMKYLTDTQLVPTAYSSVNMYFDGLHHQLLDSIEKSLDLLTPVNTISFPMNTQPSVSHDQNVASTPKRQSITRPIHVKCKLGPIGVRIMESWYKRNQEHPYPSYDAAEVMAKAGNMSVEQVKKWFANKRRRLHNTKTLTEIARRRKRTAEPSDDFDSDAKRARQA